MSKKSEKSKSTNFKIKSIKNNTSDKTKLKTKKEILGAIKNNKPFQFSSSITTLDLTSKKIKVQGTLQITISLENNSTLTSLSLWDNEIGDEGASHMAKFIENNSTLTHLSLGVNQIGPEGASHLALALQNNSTLTSLNLYNNVLGDQGASHISMSFQNNSTLTSLDLSNNQIGKEGASQIATSLQNNYTLTTIGLFNNNNIGQVLQNIDNLLRRNKEKPKGTIAKAQSTQAYTKGEQLLGGNTLGYIGEQLLGGNTLGYKGEQLLGGNTLGYKDLFGGKGQITMGDFPQKSLSTVTLLSKKQFSVDAHNLVKKHLEDIVIKKTEKTRCTLFDSLKEEFDELNLNEDAIILENIKPKLNFKEFNFGEYKIFFENYFPKNFAVQSELKEELKNISQNEKTLKTSNFLKYYSEIQPPEFQDELFSAVRTIIKEHCLIYKIEEGKGVNFFKDLEKEAFDNKDELLGEVTGACVRLWTSTKQLQKREFCSIFNESIRRDDKKFMNAITLICRGINKLCVSRDFSKISWPGDNLLYRGSGLPDDQQYFFTPNKLYRCPMYLASSKDMKVSKQIFCKREAENGRPPILWVIQLDPIHHCSHVNYVDKTHVQGEEEFLFAPYSVFKVLSVDWKEDPKWIDPHVVWIEAAVDNLFHPNDLPLSPWH